MDSSLRAGVLVEIAAMRRWRAADEAARREYEDADRAAHRQYLVKANAAWHAVLAIKPPRPIEEREYEERRRALWEEYETAMRPVRERCIVAMDAAKAELDATIATILARRG